MQHSLDAALQYAKLGIPVFPCSPGQVNAEIGLVGAKRPLIHQGFKKATTDPDQIRAWWTKWPAAMIGIPTGRASGFMVLDVDYNADPTKNGLESLKRLPQLPATPTVTTPSGGQHYYFKHVDGVRNSASQIAPGIDVRGDGGYVIAPPSRLANGRGYEGSITK